MRRSVSAFGRNLRLGWWILLAIVAGVALQIAFWGRPIPPQYTVAVAAAGPPHEWLITRLGSRVETWRARDTEDHGVMDRFETPSGIFQRPRLASPSKRWLVICLDGVPLGLMQALWDQGNFREFHRPTAVISTFPSDSETAVTAALHTAPVPGYEHLYFDRAENRMRGGVWVTLTGRNIPYIRALDYDAPGWAKGVVYVVSRKSFRADLGRLRNAFLSSDKKVLLAHLATSDSILHVLPASEVELLIGEFESLVRTLYLDSRGQLAVLIFSDHGNTLVPSRAVPLETFLSMRGWRVRNTLAGPRDVAVPAYGLIGFIAVYCPSDTAPELARQLTALEGTELVITRDPGGSSATILRAGAQARLGWNAGGNRYSHTAIQGDPLELAPVFDQLRREGRLAADGTATDDDLFRATANARFPDAAARIRDWGTNHVRNPANILVSLAPGHFYGKEFFARVVSLRGAHGAMDASSSLGFAMSTDPLPPAVRLGNLLRAEFLQGRPTVVKAATSAAR